MRIATKTAAFGLMLFLAGCGGGKHEQQPAASGPGGSQSFTLTVLHINDHHSHLDAENIALQLDTGGKREPSH